WLGPAIAAWQVDEGREHERLRAALAWLKLRADDEARARERLGDEIDDHLASLRDDVAGALGPERTRRRAADAAIDRRVRALAALLAELTARLTQVERILRAERVAAERSGAAGAAGAGAIVQAAIPEPSTAGFDYLAFEDRFRGAEEVIRERQRHHLERFAGCRRVADLGCGRGEFLRLLREAGIEAVG